MGTIYHKGNVIFTSDGNSVISPVGNKLTIYDLKKYVLRSEEVILISAVSSGSIAVWSI